MDWCARPSSGVLMHISSLPGGHGIGDLGPSARAFVDWLAAAGQRFWQVLPCAPTGFADSPYQTLSTFAGNPALISLQDLSRDGLGAEITPWSEDNADFGRVHTEKCALLAAAATEFLSQPGNRDTIETFCQTNPWVTDYATFQVLKHQHAMRPWYEWPLALRDRGSEAVAELVESHESAFLNQITLQYFFAQQWQALRSYAHENGVQLVGDLPIYVAHDSCEVWAQPELFEVDAQGQLLNVAGVPPDYFSRTGQRWGNPLYQWNRHEADGFSWWITRLAHHYAMYDVVRIDHFRGFDAYWSIPAEEETAVNGTWRPAPGDALFAAAREALGSLPTIAEDLGEITPQVHELRARFGFPGMRVLQFGYDGDPNNPHFAANADPNSVCYTGTHDNDTTRGWLTSLDDATAERVGRSDDNSAWHLIDTALGCRAQLVIVPMQDVLDLDSEHRMNTPGSCGANWQWRMRSIQLDRAHADRLAATTRQHGR